MDKTIATLLKNNKLTVNCAEDYLLQLLDRSTEYSFEVNFNCKEDSKGRNTFKSWEGYAGMETPSCSIKIIPSPIKDSQYIIINLDINLSRRWFTKAKNQILTVDINNITVSVDKDHSYRINKPALLGTRMQQFADPTSNNYRAGLIKALVYDNPQWFSDEVLNYFDILRS